MKSVRSKELPPSQPAKEDEEIPFVLAGDLSLPSDRVPEEDVMLIGSSLALLLSPDDSRSNWGRAALYDATMRNPKRGRGAD